MNPTGAALPPSLALATAGPLRGRTPGRAVLGSLTLALLLVALRPAPTGAQALPRAVQDKLTGQVQSPSISPSNPDIIAYGRLFGDAQELYVYDRRAGRVQRIQVPTADADGRPAQASFTNLFEAQNLDQFSRYDGQLAWRPRLDARQRQWFAFVSGSDAGFDLYLWYLRADGRLATSPPLALPLDGLEQFPQWSPDGQRLAFVSGNESGSDLYLLPDVRTLLGRGDAAQPLRLTANPDLEAHPAWSPDGDYLAFQTLTTQDGRQNWGISVVRPADLQGGSVALPVSLTDDLSAYDEFKPSWAPDGQHLAFYVSQARIGEQTDNLQQDIGVLGVVRSSGSDRIVRGRLLSGFSPRLAVNVIPNQDRGPSWMPVADALLLVHVKRDAQANFPLYVTDFRRWQRRQPGYEQPLSASFGTQYHRDPVLAALPTGVRVAFISQVGGANRLQVFDRPGPPGEVRVVTIPVEKSQRTALTRSLVMPGLGQFYKGQPTKGLLLLAAEAATLGAAFFFHTQVDGRALDDLEAAYRASVIQPGGCPAAPSTACENEAFRAWQDAYDSARTNQTLAVAAVGVAAGLWVFNLLDSAGGFPRTVDQPVRVAAARPRRPTTAPYLASYGGTPHYGLRLQIPF